jgi:predicted small lipoprotein YifL
MRSLLSLLILSLTLSMGLSGCGRKNPPKPPTSYVPKEGTSNTTEGEFKEYRPAKNHTVGTQP